MSSPALPDVFALLGRPAAGNPAQYLFERAIERAGLDARFISADVAADRLADVLAGAAAMAFRGCLLAGAVRTAALPLAAAATPAATFAGAASLLVLGPEGFTAHMTDGRGVVESLRTHRDPAGRRALVVGGGATGRAAALELSLAGAAGLVVCDRDPAVAAGLATALDGLDVAGVATIEAEPAVAVPADVGIVVVAVPPAAMPTFTGLRADLVVVECGLAPQPSPLATVVAASGACLVDGLEVHAARAVIDFRTLTGADADPDLLRDALDEFLSA
jgi:shikimate dehydrogenase